MLIWHMRKRAAAVLPGGRCLGARFGHQALAELLFMNTSAEYRLDWTIVKYKGNVSSG
jgi:hypothetical protein